MSSKYVRDWIRSQVATPGYLAINVPFYDTINTDQDPDDPLWATAEFNVESHSRISLCDGQLEEGVIDFVVSAQAGTGDEAALIAAEAAAAYLLQQKDPSGQLVLLTSQPPEDYSEGSGDRSYRVVVGLEYRYYS
jgi:hypothetical protein